MIVETLSGGARPDFEIFQIWMVETAILCDEFWECNNYYPFDQGELAAVSVLCAAAARGGFTPIAEYKIRKIGSESGGCRADLWFNWEDTSRSFEFKHWRNSQWGIEDLQNNGICGSLRQNDTGL